MRMNVTAPENLHYPAYGPAAPRVLVIAQIAHHIALAEAEVLAAGARLAASLRVQEALPYLKAEALPDVIMLELEHDDGHSLDVLLEELDRIAIEKSLPVIISTVPELLDIVAAHIQAFSAIILCNPSPTDRMAALLMSWHGAHATLHDSKHELGQEELAQLAQDVERIARSLTLYTRRQAPKEALLAPADLLLGGADATEDTKPEISAAYVRNIIKNRRLRERYFDAELFSDPVWDMLLDLYAAQLEGHKVSVSSLCIAAAVPATTALRYIRRLTDSGVFVRVPDYEDGRRAYISLSQEAEKRLYICLHSMRSSGY